MKITAISKNIYKPIKQINKQQPKIPIVNKMAKQALIPTVFALSALLPSSCISLQKNAKVNDDTEFVQSKKSREENLPYDIQGESIQHSERFVMDGKNYTMYYTDYCEKFADRKNTVLNVHFVPDDFVLQKKGNVELNSPPNLLELVHHHPDDKEKEFVSAIVSESNCNADGSDYKVVTQQIILPKKVGKKLLNLYQGKTKWNMAVGVDTYSESNSSTLMKPIVQQGKISLKLK